MTTPETHRNRINDVMKNFYDIRGMTVARAKGLVRSVESDLIALLPDYQSSEGDYRLGNETYGYKDSDEGILYHLMYLSDRWGSAFRIAWLLGLVNDKYR